MKGGISKSTVHRGGDEHYVSFFLGYENEISLYFAYDFTGRDTPYLELFVDIQRLGEVRRHILNNI